jgi:hypothetical protein
MKIFEDWLIESHPSTWQGDGYYTYRGGHYKNKDDYYEYNPGRKEAEIKSACIRMLMSYFNKFKMTLEKTGKVKTYARYKVPFTIGEDTFYVIFADEKRSLDKKTTTNYKHGVAKDSPVTSVDSIIDCTYLVCKFVGFEGENTASFKVKEGTEPCVPCSQECLNEIGKLLMDMKNEKSSEEATKKFITQFKSLSTKYESDRKEESYWRDCYIKVNPSKKKK